MEKLYNIKQTAQVMDLTSGHIHRLVKLGRIPARRVGRKLFFSSADIEQYMTGVPVVPKKGISE